MGKRSLIASLVTLAMGLAPAAGDAAGLGRLSILSGIGQPLVGEIELVSVGKDELSSLAARVASPDAFSSANIQFNPALVGARVSIERRPNGQPYIRVTSTRSIDEPFIDLLVELTWSTGRLVREYTALIDPPGVAPAPAAAPVPAVGATPTPAARVAPSARPQAAAPAPAADPGQKTYGPVQPGDTLRKIAAGVRPQGVNLDQVLVGIVRSNPDAFINNNMNLLRTGKILRIPDATELGQVTVGDAAKEVRTQSADWNAYRQRVAGAVPEVAAGETRAAAGKIATKVDDAAAPQTPGKEVVKISKGAPDKEAPAADRSVQDRIRVLEEEVTAREKTLKDSADRIASLEKTIKDLQRLLELKGAVPATIPGATTEPGTPAVTEAKPEPKAEPKPPVEAKAQPKPMTPPPPPAPAVAEWWEDPAVLGGGLLGLGALGGAGYLLARRRRQQAEAAYEAPPVVRRAPSVAPVAGAAGAAAAAAAVATTQIPAPAPAAAAPADDVDPIAEADVYIAYGRDAQAEEILREALSKTPNRQEVKVKLLEIYAARKSKGDFNALANEVHSATGGRGDLWLRAATMGYALDPDNVLYAAGKDSAGMVPIGVQTDVNLDFDLDMVSAAGAPSTVTDLPLEAGPAAGPGHEVTTTILSPERMAQLRADGAAQAAEGAPVIPDINVSAEVPAAPSTDIMLDTAMREPITDVNLDIPPVKPADSNIIDFEFDPSKTANLQAPNTATFDPDKTMIISPENQSKAEGLDVEIDLGALDAKVPAAAANDVPAAEPTSDLSFDFNLPAVEAPPTVSGVVPPTDIKLDVPDFKPADTATMDFALDTVSFDLGSGQVKDAAQSAGPVHDDHWYDVQTKFDLAKAYQEMGDKEGAREILSEVVKEGDAQQQVEAKALLDKLA